MKTSTIRVKAPVTRHYTIALIADTHNHFSRQLKRALSGGHPDCIVISGDLINRHDVLCESQKALDFLTFCASVAPTFYALGNHEGELGVDDMLAVLKTGVVLLDDGAVQFGELNIGGLSSGYKKRDPHFHSTKEPVPNLDWLRTYAGIKGYKILLCHHPEYYERYIRGLDIDLTLSGHAHGGQIRIFGQGLFAPGQGILPKVTSGLYDGRLIVSRGLCNTAWPIPRLNNETELVMVELTGSAPSSDSV